MDKIKELRKKAKGVMKYYETNFLPFTYTTSFGNEVNYIVLEKGKFLYIRDFPNTMQLESNEEKEVLSFFIENY